MGIIAPDEHRSRRSALQRKGLFAISGIAGGIGLVILGILPAVFGIVAGGVAIVAGIAACTSYDREDKFGGRLLIVSGALSVLFRIGRLPVIKAICGVALSCGGFILLGLGIYNGLQFLWGIRGRD
jgi:hypothetical protein